MEENFERYPHVEIISDALGPSYRVKYTECVVERGTVRFVRRERVVPRSGMESLVGDIVRRAEELGGRPDHAH